MSRLLRVVGSLDPSDWDLMSHWDRGHRPRPYRSAQVRAYKGVSTFETLEQAWGKAIANGPGDFIAELDVPDHVSRIANGGGHVDLHGTTPRELRQYIVSVQRIPSRLRA